MPASGFRLVAQQLMTTIVFQLLRLVFITVQHIYWQLNGTARKLREARLPQNYERSAQVLDVVFAHKFCPMQMTSIRNFICTHNRFESLQYIIDNDNITLMTINEYNAIFCEPAEKGGPGPAFVCICQQCENDNSLLFHLVLYILGSFVCKYVYD